MSETVVVAGASGFVGRHVVDRLRQQGHQVRCGTRDPDRASSVRPGFDWVELDVDQPETLDRAFAGATALVFLVHRMRDDAHDLHAAELNAAIRVREAAERAGLRRIVYLGGPAPRDVASEHLRARLATGEALRAGSISAIELRAGMVIGAGSESWLIVRDLAMRLPLMILPAWLNHRSQPIWVGDVTAAISHALTDPRSESAWFDLPGPETLSGRAILERVALARGMRPWMVPVPVLTPRLSSHWIRLVTRADYAVAKRLVDGLTEDLVAESDGYWLEMPEHRRVPFDEAVKRALAAESRLGGAGVAWERFAQAVARGAPRPK